MEIQLFGISFQVQIVKVMTQDRYRKPPIIGDVREELVVSYGSMNLILLLLNSTVAYQALEIQFSLMKTVMVFKIIMKQGLLE